jgi:acetyl esterase/lipase
VVGGDSAGGNLTIALINRRRAAGEEQPACAWLASPWTDLTMSGASLATKGALDPLTHKGYLEELASAYAPAGWRRSRMALAKRQVRPRRSSMTFSRTAPPSLLAWGWSKRAMIDLEFPWTRSIFSGPPDRPDGRARMLSGSGRR